MRPVPSAQVRRLAALAAALLCLLSLPTGTLALGDPGSCPDPANPAFAIALDPLYQAIGPAMGSPAECPHVDANGDTLQVTTTGLAIARPDGTLAFASGEQHWSLSADGLRSWSGSWHNGLYPPALPPPTDLSTAPDQVPVASVHPLKIIEVARNEPNTVLVQDHAGGTFALEAGSGCPDLANTVGEQVFMRSGGPETDLILLEQHETCAVAAMYAADSI